MGSNPSPCIHAGSSSPSGFPHLALAAGPSPAYLLIHPERSQEGSGKTVVIPDPLDWEDERVVRRYFTRWSMEEEFHAPQDVMSSPATPISYRIDKQIGVHVFLCAVGLPFHRWVQWRVEDGTEERVPILRLHRWLDEIRVTTPPSSGLASGEGRAGEVGTPAGAAGEDPGAGAIRPELNGWSLPSSSREIDPARRTRVRTALRPSRGRFQGRPRPSTRTHLRLHAPAVSALAFQPTHHPGP